ncbi:MAG: plastocyanin/azurin family copper-binding protein [Patescibacteria group bacterium]
MKIITIFLLSILFGVFISSQIYKLNKPVSKPLVLSTTIHTISLLEKGANPDAITAKVGEYVQFNTKDNKKHEMALGKGNEFEKGHEHLESSVDSGVFGPGEAYKIQFKEKGTFHFHDHLNPNIYVAVVVY